MGEYAFHGGYQGSMDAIEHYLDRQNGMPRVGVTLEMPADSTDYSPHAKTGKGIKVNRLACAGSGVGCGLGFAGYISGPVVDGFVYLHRDGIASQRVRDAIEAEIRRRWGGGKYSLHLDVLIGACGFEVTVDGPSKMLDSESKPESQPESEPESKPVLERDGMVNGRVIMVEIHDGVPVEVHGPEGEIRVGATVWLELSNDGPYKVLGRYCPENGGEVQASHPHDAPNCYEKVRGVKDLWLCEDRKGKVHILSAGALTTTPPPSRISRIGSLAGASLGWVWARREVALWITVAGMAATLLV